MPNVLARCTALGIVAGGFALTGDLGWLAEKGSRVLESRTVPGGERTVAAAPQTPAGDGRAVRSAPAPRPPADGPDRVSLPSLRPGARLLVWVGPPPPATGQRCLVLDVVDPATAAVLVYEAAGSSSGNLVTALPPRRVTILSGAGRPVVLARGQPLALQAAGFAGPPAAETIGPVAAIAVVP